MAGAGASIVSVLFSEPKIPQSSYSRSTSPNSCVSVLFSEPKIPQSQTRRRCVSLRTPFQCSSASRKFLNKAILWQPSASGKFQCSSASRKFLNSDHHARTRHTRTVSVLFSEPKIPQLPARSRDPRRNAEVSVLFSEPKIPQFIRSDVRVEEPQEVSVLFSEPKIPQLHCLTGAVARSSRFSALQRAENSSIAEQTETAGRASGFQCSSASRKFLNFVLLRTPER